MHCWQSSNENRLYPACTQSVSASLGLYPPRQTACGGFKAEKVLSRLRDYPESGRTLPEFPDIHYREVIVTPYQFFYRVKDNVVWVVAVWHGAQIPEDP